MASHDMQAAAQWYLGRTTHARLRPFTHRFAYRTTSVLIDVDRLDEADAQSRFFSVERLNLFSFHRRDHGARETAPLRPWAHEAFSKAGVAVDDARIQLLCFPRVLGYVFNPLSLWFARDPDGSLRGVIYEVHNTFGDAHAYVAAADTSRVQQAATPKLFHVSPFFAVDGAYRFRLRPPSSRYALAIRYTDADGADLFTAAHTAEARPLNDASALGVFCKQPLSTHKAIAGIHWEALHLWRKGARYHSRPQPPAPVSVVRSAMIAE